ncbi:MAG: hypothetical protein E6J42_09195 [Chloroflexi bacterium]|nr:MAG: hypothetical protein E6J42_09195 [Chloroflexota bacterium]
MYSKILLSLDGSTLSEAVLPHVSKLAVGTSARVTLLTVSESAEPAASSPRLRPERLIAHPRPVRGDDSPADGC